MLGDLRAYLGGVTVDGLTACDDDVPVQGSESSGESIGGSEGVGSGKLPVS